MGSSFFKRLARYNEINLPKSSKKDNNREIPLPVYPDVHYKQKEIPLPTFANACFEHNKVPYFDIFSNINATWEQKATIQEADEIPWSIIGNNWYGAARCTHCQFEVKFTTHPPPRLLTHSTAAGNKCLGSDKPISKIPSVVTCGVCRARVEVIRDQGGGYYLEEHHNCPDGGLSFKEFVELRYPDWGRLIW